MKLTDHNVLRDDIYLNRYHHLQKYKCEHYVLAAELKSCKCVSRKCCGKYGKQYAKCYH